MRKNAALLTVKLYLTVIFCLIQILITSLLLVVPGNVVSFPLVVALVAIMTNSPSRSLTAITRGSFHRLRKSRVLLMPSDGSK